MKKNKEGRTKDMGKICEHYDLDCKQEERSCKGCAFNNKKARDNFLTVKKKPLKFKGQCIDKIYFEEPIMQDFISNQVKAIIEHENKTTYGIISLIMKKCNIEELEFTPYELENLTYNNLITIKNPKTNNLIVKVVK